MVILMGGFGLKREAPNFANESMTLCLMGSIHGLHNAFGQTVSDLEVLEWYLIVNDWSDDVFGTDPNNAPRWVGVHGI